MAGKRSIGVTAFGLVAILLGALVAAGPIRELLTYELNLYVALGISAGMLLMVSGVFILRRRSWARWLFLGLMGGNTVLGLQGVYYGVPLAVVPGVEWIYWPAFLLLSLLPFVVAVYYFTRPYVKDQFK